MVDGVVVSSLSTRLRLIPWWARVVGVYCFARLVTTVLVLVLAETQDVNPWTPANPGFFDFASIWDGRWYYIIAVSGYPSELPVTPSGAVAENAWAFMPAYPAICAVLMFLTALPWPVVAVAVSLIFGAAAALIFYRLMRTVLTDSQSLFAVALFCFSPISPLMQFAYAEAMYFFLLACALYLLVRRSYAVLFPVVAVMALTRPSGLAFALTIALHGVYRFAVRGRDPFSFRDRMMCAVLVVFSAFMGFAWLLVAAMTTGSITGYTDTELAWRIPYIGSGELLPFAPWFQGAHWWFSEWMRWPDWAGPAILLVLLCLFGAFLLTRPVKKLGVDIRLWTVSYSLYLLAVFFPQSSTFRLLGPLFPLWGAVAQPKNVWYRGLLLVVCVALQWGWLLLCWRVAEADWTPP